MRIFSWKESNHCITYSTNRRIPIYRSYFHHPVHWALRIKTQNLAKRLCDCSIDFPREFFHKIFSSIFCNKTKCANRAVENPSLIRIKAVCSRQKVIENLDSSRLTIVNDQRIDPKKLWQQISKPLNLHHRRSDLLE